MSSRLSRRFSKTVGEEMESVLVGVLDGESNYIRGSRAGVTYKVRHNADIPSGGPLRVERRADWFKGQ